MASGKSKRRRSGHPAKVAERRERERQRANGTPDLRRVASITAREAARLESALDAELFASSLLGSMWPAPVFPPVDDPQYDMGRPIADAIARIGGRGAVAALVAIGELSDGQLGPHARRLADKLIAAGAPAPPWRQSLEAARIIRGAEMYEDVFDDARTILLEAVHGDGERHVVGVLVDHNLGGLARDILIAESLDDIERSLREHPDPRAALRLEPIPAGQAAARIHAALELTDMTLDAPVSDDFAELRALALLRADDCHLDPDVDTDPPQLSREDRDALLEQFLAAPEGCAFEPESIEADVCATAIDFCADYVDGRPLRWSPIVVELFMAGYLPSKIIAHRDYFEAVPAALNAWVRFAARERAIPDWATDAVLQTITETTPDMLDATARGADRGPAAQLLAAARDAGIDPADTSALTRFIEEWNTKGAIT